MGTSTVDWDVGEGFLEEVVSELSFEAEQEFAR